MTAEPHEASRTAERLAAFARLLTGDHDVDDILERLADFCTELLPLHGVGVLLRTEDNELVVATANTEEGRGVEELEVELREGPCTDALRLGEPVRCHDLRTAVDRYPRFAPAALELGVHGVNGVPMSVRGGAVGVLDLVSMEPVELHPAETTTAQLLADVAISYIENNRLAQRRSRLSEQLQHALDSRIPVEQAKGVLAERHGVTPDEAFERIRRHARSTQRPVREVAERVVRGELRI